MAIKVLALASGVTGLGDHRVLNGAMLQPSGTLAARGGVLPGVNSGNLTTVSAMVARVAPVKVVIPNGVSAALGPYLLVSDANVDITFAAGEASVTRTDRIIAIARDDTNDGSGSTAGSIEYLKGQASGSATALPTNSVLLYEMPIPAGASAGGGGVNFANAVDQRIYTAAQGGIFPVKNNTDMNAILNPHEGMTIYRTDLDVLYIFDTTTWRAKGVPNVASSSNLGDINNPYDGLVATTRDTDALYVYNGSAWTQPKFLFKPIGRCVQNAGQSIPDNTATAMAFAAEDFDTHNQHDTSTNNSRVTPNVAGYYRFRGTAMFGSRSDYVVVNAWIRKNGSTNLAPAWRAGYGTPTNPQVQTAIAESIQLMNGTTDYCELVVQTDNSGNVAVSTNQSSQFSSALEWEYIGPSSY